MTDRRFIRRARRPRAYLATALVCTAIWGAGVAALLAKLHA